MAGDDDVDVAGDAPDVLLAGKLMKLTPFSGKESYQQATQFREKAEVALKSSGLMVEGKAEEAIAYVAYAFKEDAYQWYRTTLVRHPNMLKHVPTFWKLFQLRFEPDPKGAARVTIAEGLKQKPTETVRAFADRCYAGQKLLWTGKPAEFTEAENYLELLEDEAKDRFLAGLKTEIRQRIEQRLQDARTFDDTVMVAATIEEAVKDKKPSMTVAETVKASSAQASGTEDQGRRLDKVEIAVTQLVEALGRLNTGARPRQSPRGGQGRGAARGRGRGPLGGCFTCGQQGHWARKCPRRATAAAGRGQATARAPAREALTYRPSGAAGGGRQSYGVADVDQAELDELVWDTPPDF